MGLPWVWASEGRRSLQHLGPAKPTEWQQVWSLTQSHPLFNQLSFVKKCFVNHAIKVCVGSVSGAWTLALSTAKHLTKSFVPLSFVSVVDEAMYKLRFRVLSSASVSSKSPSKVPDQEEEVVRQKTILPD